MPAPDFARSRRDLRRSRLEDALGLPREVNVQLHRDRLLERLAVNADNPVETFERLDPGVVDTVVSLAVAETDEDARNTLPVVLLCIRVLAADGQFARLSLLADKLHDLSQRLSTENPFLALATEGFALVLKNEDQRAQWLLEDRLGLSDKYVEPIVQPERDPLHEILMAALLRAVLINPETRMTTDVRDLALSTADGLLLSYVEAVTTWINATVRANPRVVLIRADPTFAKRELAPYLDALKIGALYPSQIRAIESGTTSDRDLVVSLPTSSGKTLLAELRIVASLMRHPGSRAIYVAPYRLLARQVVRNFAPRLDALGLRVQDLGGNFDTSLRPWESSGLADVNVCTPERLDGLLRASTGTAPASQAAADLFKSASVLVFDEVQLVGRPGRGPRFELIIARLRSKYPGIRFLGLSAASAAINNLADWLSGGDAVVGSGRPTGTLEIKWGTDGSLRQRVRPRPTKVADLPRSNVKTDAAKLILRLRPEYSPVLVVETSRTNAEGLAKEVVARGVANAGAWRKRLSAQERGRLNAAIEEVAASLGSEHLLVHCMDSGVAFHHAGVPTSVLQRVESLAASRVLRVVCATTTVAEGADLPFRVVVLPHLNFPGPSRRLERDLYQNIVGRAGRANVSVEGLVFVMASDARTLSDLVESQLWDDSATSSIRGKLAEVRPSIRTTDDWAAFNDAQSQLMGWLGDGDSYFEDQAAALAEKTLSWQSGTEREKGAIVDMFRIALDDLESNGYARAGSPLQLTSRGESARLTGLSVPTVQRLERAIDRSRDGWLDDIAGRDVIPADLATQIARLVFEGVEVADQSLWIRRVSRSNDPAKLEELTKMSTDDAFYELSDYRTDIELMSAWIAGKSYSEIARLAPVFDRANSLFGGEDQSKRTSDATEYIGKLTYAASWVWAGAKVLAGQLGEQFPAFIRSSIELGIPSESGVNLVLQAALTRPAVMAITNTVGTDWDHLVSWIAEESETSGVVLGIPSLDRERLSAFRERLIS